MIVFEMITIIAVAGIIGKIASEWIKHSKSAMADLSKINARLANLEDLKERIVVLEAIVTDKGYDLKREINNL